MEHNYEEELVYRITRLRRLFYEKTEDLQAELATFTDKDIAEFDNISQRYSYSLSKKLKSKCFNYLDFVSEKDFRKEMESLLKTLELDKENAKETFKNKIEDFSKEDLLIKLNNADPEAVKEMMEDSTMKQLMNNKSFLKFLNINNKVYEYMKETVIMFSRESSSYVGDLISTLKQYRFQDVLNDLSSKHKELEELVDKVVKLRARRNILEHNDGIIDKKYVELVKSAAKKDIGSLLVISPGYVSESFETSYKFYMVATFLVAEKLRVKIDADKLVSLLKETESFTSEIEVIKLFKF